MKNPLLEMVEKRKAGIHCGIPSFCCANKLVIEAILDQAKRFDDVVLIEATSNQVNQYRGYTGMTPEEFRNFVYQISDDIHFDRDRIILGGDHLGPLPWAHEPAAVAMEKAATLVKLSVKAGYKKIHLDTSMKLGDDPLDSPLADEVIAERGAYLYRVCENAFQDMLLENPQAEHPVFIIGSEVPVPGGANSQDNNLHITKPSDFENTILAYRKKFHELNLDDAWNYIIAVVVQPGVEFSSDQIHHYSRLESHALCRALAKYPDIVFEGHSTDYQAPKALREMVEDGIAIIKVGPALTFALREALFALSAIEKELYPDKQQQTCFPEILDTAMRKDPSSWEKHYFSSGNSLTLERKYSYSDRCRYYLAYPEVDAAINKLFQNLDATEIPMGLLHQYMPLQYIKVRDGKLSMKAKDLAKDNVVTLVEDYNYAVKCNYVTSGVFVR